MSKMDPNRCVHFSQQDEVLYCAGFKCEIRKCPKACNRRKYSQLDLFGARKHESEYSLWKSDNNQAFRFIVARFKEKAAVQSRVSIALIWEEAREIYGRDGYRTKTDGGYCTFPNALRADLARDLQMMFPHFADRLKTKTRR